MSWTRGGIIPDKTSDLPPRKGIDTFLADAVQANLFLLAFSEMQDHKKDSDPMSLFGITSIHGVPYQAWNSIMRQGERDRVQLAALLILIASIGSQPGATLLCERVSYPGEVL